MISGDLETVPLAMMLSMLRNAQATGVCSIFGADRHGKIFLSGGTIVSAESNSLRNELAAYHLIQTRSGEFRFTPDGGELDAAMHLSPERAACEVLRLQADSNRDSRFSATKGFEGALSAEQTRVMHGLGESTSLSDAALRSGFSEFDTLFYLETLIDCGAASELQETDAARTKILIVDDSALMRRVLTRIIDSDPRCVVVEAVENGQQALDCLSEVRPDVIALDLLMPVMDGVTTLRRIMASQPTPTVMMTAESSQSVALAFESIYSFGALDFAGKPSQSNGDLDAQGVSMIERLVSASRANLKSVQMFVHDGVGPPGNCVIDDATGVVCSAGGIGGCLSYVQLLSSLPPDFPFAVLGSLQLAERSLEMFVSFMAGRGRFPVEMVRDGMPMNGGRCYLANGSMGVRVENSPAGPVLRLKPENDPPMARTITDVATVFGGRAVSLLLSGTTDAEAKALSRVRAVGGAVLAQLPATCVDPGQCQRALQFNYADDAVALADVPGWLVAFFLNRQLEREKPEIATWQRTGA